MKLDRSALVDADLAALAALGRNETQAEVTRCAIEAYLESGKVPTRAKITLTREPIETPESKRGETSWREFVPASTTECHIELDFVNTRWTIEGRNLKVARESL